MACASHAHSDIACARVTKASCLTHSTSQRRAAPKDRRDSSNNTYLGGHHVAHGVLVVVKVRMRAARSVRHGVHKLCRRFENFTEAQSDVSIARIWPVLVQKLAALQHILFPDTPPRYDKYSRITLVRADTIH